MKNSKTKSNKSLIVTVAVLAVVLVALIACIVVSESDFYLSKPERGNLTSQTVQEEATPEEMPNYDDVKEIEVVDTERKNVKVTMADGQSFTICVYPDVAPQTAQNFLNLVRDGFYDGLTFHRIIDGFMAQGGDPEGTGMGGSDTNIIGEFSQNGFENSLSHKRGVVSMARSNHPNSASSQFFICYDDASFLDGQYAAFGEVVSGMEVVDSFLESGTDENDRPLEEVKIATVVVEE